MNKVILSFLFLGLFVSQSSGNITVNTYDILLEIIPENQYLKAQAHIQLDAGTEKAYDLLFYLHKEFSLTSIKSDTDIDYDFNKTEKSSYFWMKDARPLVIQLKQSNKKEINIHIAYQGPLKDLSWKTTNMITESWIELGNYSAWFPYNPDYGKFTSNVKLAIDTSYNVTGMGKINKTDKGWEIQQLKPANDIVIIASQDLKSFDVTDANNSIRLDYVFFNDQKAQETIQNAKFIIDHYKNWFATNFDVQFTIVIVPPFTDRGSYHRKNFMALLQPEPGENVSFSLIAHEIAHEWWTGARTDNFEDWLNESFAEYSSLMAIREKFGNDRFMEWIQYKRMCSRGAPPIIEKE